MNNIEQTFETMKTTVEMMRHIGPEGRKLLEEIYHRRFQDVENYNPDDSFTDMVQSASCGAAEMVRISHILMTFLDFIEEQDRFEIFYSEKYKADVLVEFTKRSFTIIKSGNELFRFLINEIGDMNKVKEIINELEDDTDRSYYLHLLKKMPKNGFKDERTI